MQAIKQQLLTGIKKLSSNRLVMAVAALALVIGVAQVVVAAQAASSAQSAFRQQLQSQVVNSDGAPRTGHDPVGQGQTSLAAAASRPTGTGMGAINQVDKPAAKVTGTHVHVQPSDVLPDSKKTGVLSNGCLADYGVPGQECVQAGGVTTGKLITCTEVRKQFPHGVKVSGTDRFNLDKNKDKIACGASD